MFWKIWRYIHLQIGIKMNFPMMYFNPLYVNSKSNYDNLKNMLVIFIGDIRTLDSAVRGMFLNGDIFAIYT